MSSEPSKPASPLELIKRFGPAALLVAGLAAAIASGALNHLSLHELRASRFSLHAFVQTHPARAVLLYLAVYLGVVCLSVPGALIMTLSGGFLFGPWVGGLLADLGCSIGAIVVFGVCRLTVGDALERRLSPRIKAFEAGFRQDAFLYLLTLRLIPVTPFWLVNLAAGLIGAPTRAFVTATVVGILPASLIYASLGAGLDGMFDRGEHLGPQLFLAPRIVLPLIGLALLSILPIVHHWWRARRGASASAS